MKTIYYVKLPSVISSTYKKAYNYGNLNPYHIPRCTVPLASAKTCVCSLLKNIVLCFSPESTPNTDNDGRSSNNSTYLYDSDYNYDDDYSSEFTHNMENNHNDFQECDVLDDSLIHTNADNFDERIDDNINFTEKR